MHWMIGFLIYFVVGTALSLAFIKGASFRERNQKVSPTTVAELERRLTEFERDGNIFMADQVRAEIRERRHESDTTAG